ncbi:hypothetical protein ABIB66_007899 [Bradyrhizobium sp. F1.13.3]
MRSSPTAASSTPIALVLKSHSSVRPVERGVPKMGVRNSTDPPVANSPRHRWGWQAAPLVLTRQYAGSRARLELPDIDNLRCAYDAALMAACALADTRNGPAIIPPSRAEWLAEGHVTCNIQCLNGRCHRRVDVRLETLPQDQPWSQVGLRLVCSSCGAAGSVHIVPNWHDSRGQVRPSMDLRF